MPAAQADLARERPRETPVATSNPDVTTTVDTDGKLAIGRQLVSGSPEQTVTVPLPSLSQHVCVFAGSGSGKTVFLKRLLEEAALCGVPSIVIDGANDLSRLGDPWPERPQSFSDEDAAKASRYHAMAEVVVWTPGRASGRALSFNPIPDFRRFPVGHVTTRRAIS
ncbi:MAG: DUF87 domain-containing protein [Polyangiaceae bacterium]